MAGKRHHFLWQHIQRGFAIPEKGGEKIWIYSRGADPRISSTKNFGVQRYFYGKEDSLADSAITDFENIYRNLIHQARNARDGEILCSMEISPLVAHLEIRSRFFREKSTQILTDTAKIAYRVAQDDRLLNAFLDVLIEDIHDFISADDPEMKNFYARLLTDHISKNRSSILEIAHREVEVSGKDQLLSILNLVEPAVREVQNTCLALCSYISLRAPIHHRLAYRVLATETDEFILPDTALLTMRNRKIAPMSMEGAAPDFVFIPLSPKCGIIGQSPCQPCPKPEEIRLWLAEVSHESFVSNRESADLRDLSSAIGRKTENFSEQFLDDLLDNFDRGAIFKNSATP